MKNDLPSQLDASPWPVVRVIETELLATRPSKHANHASENLAMLELAQALASPRDPRGFRAGACAMTALSAASFRRSRRLA